MSKLQESQLNFGFGHPALNETTELVHFSEKVVNDG